MVFLHFSCTNSIYSELIPYIIFTRGNSLITFENMRADLRVVGLQVSYPVRIAASATRFEAGEPLHNLGTMSSGVSSVTTYVLAAADTPVIGTHRFGGVAAKGALPFQTGTVAAHWSLVYRPIAWSGVLEGKAEVAASMDTEAELLGLLGDVTLIDYSATGASDGGELYTIKETASADTSGLEIVNGNFAKGLLQVVVDGRAYRHDVT